MEIVMLTVPCRNVITELLNTLPHMFKDTTRAESVYTSAVRGALEALVTTTIKLVRKRITNKRYRNQQVDKCLSSKHVYLITDLML